MDRQGTGIHVHIPPDPHTAVAVQYEAMGTMWSMGGIPKCKVRKPVRG